MLAYWGIGRVLGRPLWSSGDVERGGVGGGSKGGDVAVGGCTHGLGGVPAQPTCWAVGGVSGARVWEEGRCLPWGWWGHAACHGLVMWHFVGGASEVLGPVGWGRSRGRVSLGVGIVGSWGAVPRASHLPSCASRFLPGPLVLPGVFGDVGREVDLGGERVGLNEALTAIERANVEERCSVGVEVASSC